ncbi:hypothetical protein F2P56_031669 [Juglans regia]|uniref:NAD(P)H dehydrogenase (quinone) n=1 Tax=Juglans regia TaxID=51240 RepID=A0A833WEF5_JUGRE|nr:hypothetical protein F2P56_031669 [Juglans regia]
MSEVKRGRKMEDQEEAKPVVRVAAISGSLRKRSNHRGLIRAAIQLCEDSIDGMQIEHIEIEQLPMLNTDLEDKGTYPPVVEAFRQKIKEADCVLFASPEYNFSLSGTILSLILQLMCFQFKFGKGLGLGGLLPSV